MDYEKLRIELSASDESEWDSIVEAAIGEELDYKSEDLSGSRLGQSVVVGLLNDDSIEASVSFTMYGEATPDEDGSYQDEDGASYEMSENEHNYLISITADGISWEQE